MSRMIDDLLDISGITEGKIELRKSPVALEAILTAATSLVRSSCTVRHRQLAVSLPAEPVFLNGDATRLVKLHGGSVEAHSEGLGHGSEFIVHLPILREAPPPPPPPPPVARETSRRILIVDDNTDSARSMAILQTRRGHVTRVAFTGPDALAVAAEFLPELVLLDIGLPGMDGFEVARHLRKMPALAGTKLIAMTGYASPEDIRAATEAGFDEHLVKPVDLETLRDWMQTRGWSLGSARHAADPSAWLFPNSTGRNIPPHRASAGFGLTEHSKRASYWVAELRLLGARSTI